jgi:hypothetical protein
MLSSIILKFNKVVIWISKNYIKTSDLNKNLLQMVGTITNLNKNYKC